VRIKGDLNEFLGNVEADVKHAVQQSFIVNAPSYYGEQVSFNFNEMISKAVAVGVSAAMERLIASQYTDEDFEHDIGLKP